MASEVSMWSMDWVGWALLCIQALLAVHFWRNGRLIMMGLREATAYLGRPENLPLAFIVGATIVPVSLYLLVVAAWSVPMAVMILVLP